MIKIGNLDIDKFYLGDSSDVKIYLGEIKLYPKDEPQPVVSCYEIIPQPISQYASTTYDSVYSWSDAKWYMKNNLSQYEEYGIYDIVENISSATTYNGKLAVVGTTEYQYSGGSWSVVGTYEDASTTYEITDEDPYEYEGVELSTTFKIPTADIEALGGWLDFRIRTSDGDNLNIGTGRYNYMGNDWYEGTVTNDNDYYYYELPDIDSVVIQQIQYRNSTPIHLIVGSKQASVEYSAKTTPSSALTYSSVADMEAVSCPTVGVGQYCYTNEQIYKFTSNEEWVTAQDSEIMMFALDGSGNARILACGYNSGDIPKKAAFDFTAVEAYFGHCVTSIDGNLFSSMYELKSISATSVVPPITIDWAFGTNPSNLKIYVPCSSVHTYRTSKGWKTYANIIDSNEPNCQIESFKARFYDANNNLIGELQRTYDTNGSNITSAETKSYASSTYRVELGDAFIRIQDSAFKGFSHITNLSIGNNVIFVGSNFVNGCTALQTLEFPSDYGTYFSTNLICNCNSLKKITIPSGTTGIYRSSIYNCSSLQSITILKPNGVLSFWDSSGTVFPNTNNCAIYVPSNLVNSYKSASGWSTVASRIQAIPTPTYQWVSYSEGDTIPSEGVYKTYGLRIPTQALLDIVSNGKEVSIEFYSEEVDHEQHSVSVIQFGFPYDDWIFFKVNGQSQEISYDPESDEYLEIIFSDYGVNYNYNVASFNYGEQGDTEIVYEFPFSMDLYEEDT